MVIQIASACPQTMRDAEQTTGCDPAFLMAAAEFYIQKILCFEGADAYRTLGVQPSATRDQMRLHMRYLMKSLHPDTARSAWRAAAAARVLAAWRDMNAKPTMAVSDARASPRARRRHRAPSYKPASYKPAWVPRPIVKPKRLSATARPSRRVLRTVVFLVALLSPNVFASEDTTAPPQDQASAPDANPSPALSTDGASLQETR